MPKCKTTHSEEDESSMITTESFFTHIWTDFSYQKVHTYPQCMLQTVIFFAWPIFNRKNKDNTTVAYFIFTNIHVYNIQCRYLKQIMNDY